MMKGKVGGERNREEGRRGEVENGQGKREGEVRRRRE